MSNSAKIAIIVGGIILALLIAVPLISGLFGGGQYGWGMMGPGMMGGYGITGGLMIIPMVLFWGLIIWGIVALARGVNWTGNTGSSTSADSSLEILKRRYARGEINKEEYEDKKKDLV